VPAGEFTAEVRSSAPAEDEAFALADVDPLFLVSAEDVGDDLAEDEEEAGEDAGEETEEDAEDEAVDTATWVGDELVQVGSAVAPAPL
jgi:hypothetical protein